MEEWDYEAHSDESAALRAQRIIAELQQRPERNILVVSHRGIIECFTEGTVFANCGVPSQSSRISHTTYWH